MTKIAKLSEMRPRTVLFPDDGFTCLGANHPKEVKVGSSGNLYVECSAGEHSLNGQISESDWDTLVGLSLEPWPGLMPGAKQEDSE